ncbi:protein translocase subunit SecD [Cerasicoccus arenae]|uniref:Multifunctional fusion protein n=1 Tax=Cerasicoccus arenae TaxID=424488 RepID=A0A8J3GBG3_9BACT|nr:protein translocase subunit SecD [Cerasicoccus arenae]MBK1858303.1 protein translocase subunit SecD [Cerasicoccus arenae]GHB90644.1 protein translocase subunit SecDF [Cerasicoccus arenae]
MKTSIIWKLVITAVIMAWAVLSLFPLNDTDFREYVVAEPVVNQAEFSELVEEADANVNEGYSFIAAFRDLANDKKINLHEQFFPYIKMVREPNLVRSNQIILDYLYGQSRGKLHKGLDLAGGVSLILSIDENDPNAQGDRLEKAVEIISGRINGLGVAEPVIRPLPPSRIEVQLPGVDLRQNPELVIDLVQAARMDFRTAHRYTYPSNTDEVGTLKSLPLNPAEPNGPTAMFEVMADESTDPKTGETSVTKLWVKKIPEAHGDIIKEAYVDPRGGTLAVGFSTTSEGSKIMKAMTERIVNENEKTRSNELLVVVLDGKLESAATVQSVISDRGQITGDYSETEVRQLVSALNNPLEFDLSIDQKQEIGPSLAKDAQSASVSAALYGAIAVVVFMLIYYLFSGVIAVFSVLLSLVIVLGVLAGVGATISLPGVAALVLTMGMAVDANILIFERIREELQSGKKAKTALISGYDKALSTIVDANVTTMITAAILFLLGTGPVKGFGLTLAIGIGASVFAALIISRALLEIFVHTGLGKHLIPNFSLHRSLGIKSINFLGKRIPAFVASWMLVLAGLIAVGVSWDHIGGTDFTGGAEVTFDFEQSARGDLEITRILEIAASNDLGEIQPVFQSEIGQGVERLRVQMDDMDGRTDQVMDVLLEAFPDANLTKVSESIIGASVSHKIVVNAVWSIAVALLGILLYVALRFEIGYGVGAIVATIHDVLMSIGLFVILGQFFGIGSGQFTAPMIAAILMIVGYSINDTIVVFDRIREELELNPAMKLFDVINLAISRTLSRTLLTSITTFVAALALFIFGVGVVTDFALVFLIGIVTGTFSSIFIASPVFYAWHKGDRKHVTEHEYAKPTYEWEAGSKRASKESDAKSAPVL